MKMIKEKKIKMKRRFLSVKNSILKEKMKMIRILIWGLILNKRVIISIIEIYLLFF
jgi:hypothetical protein